MASTNAALRAGLTGSGRRLRQLKVEAEWLAIIERMLAPRPKERIKMGQIMGSLGSGKVSGGGRRRSLDGGGAGGYSAQAGFSLGLGGQGAGAGALVDLDEGKGVSKAVVRNMGEAVRQRPELSVFDGYFQQQSRRLEPAGGW